jgi:hypothetical protein
VAFGPRWQNSRDAALLLKAGAAVALPQSGGASPVEALQDLWEGWIRDESTRKSQGARAHEVVERGLGASDRSARLLERLISGPPPHRSLHEAQSGQQSAP